MDIELDTLTHDLTLSEDGLIGQVTELDELCQSLKIAVRTYLGEWAFDTAAGVNYRGLIFTRPEDQEAIRQEIVRVVLERDGVEAVTSVTIETDPLSRASVIDVLVQTVYGALAFTV